MDTFFSSTSSGNSIENPLYDDFMHLLRQSEAFVRILFAEQLPKQYLFHNIAHTEEVVHYAQEIGAGVGLDAYEQALVALAAWFHDAGYAYTYHSHEQQSVEIMRAFVLRELETTSAHRSTIRTAAHDIITRVSGCIMATQMPQQPHNLLEQVLCDADLANLGTEGFLNQTERLRSEIEWYSGVAFTDAEWYTHSLTFCLHHRYHTEYARRRFAEQQAANAAWFELISQYNEHEQHKQ
jgi:predicted metal-dependent HD superfamily phosphohydrolase